MMAENAGRSLKFHIQQYFMRSYLKINFNAVRLQLGQCNILACALYCYKVCHVLTEVLHMILVFSFCSVSGVEGAQQEAPAQGRVQSLSEEEK